MSADWAASESCRRRGRCPAKSRDGGQTASERSRQPAAERDRARPALARAGFHRRAPTNADSRRYIVAHDSLGEIAVARPCRRPRRALPRRRSLPPPRPARWSGDRESPDRRDILRASESWAGAEVSFRNRGVSSSYRRSSNPATWSRPIQAPRVHEDAAVSVVDHGGLAPAATSATAGVNAGGDLRPAEATVSAETDATRLL